MLTPLVSILIPAYNASAWIAETLESAVAQTWTNKEVIVIDDGSVDDTFTIAQRFASRQVQVVRQENAGASAARNHALRLAQGSYVQWLDADDLLAPDKVASQLRPVLLDECSSRTLLTSAWGRFYWRRSKVVFTPNSLWCDLGPAQWLRNKFKHDAWMAINAWLVSRETLLQAGQWDRTLTLDDDGEYFARVVKSADHIKFVSNACSFVRRATLGSLSSQNILSESKRASQLRSIFLQIQYLREIDDGPETREACLQYLQRWFIYFYPEFESAVIECRKLALELNGVLSSPSLGWKYDLVRQVVGWKWAKAARFTFPNWKAGMKLNWDRAMHLCGIA